MAITVNAAQTHYQFPAKEGMKEKGFKWDVEQLRIPLSVDIMKLNDDELKSLLDLSVSALGAKYFRIYFEKF